MKYISLAKGSGRRRVKPRSKGQAATAPPTAGRFVGHADIGAHAQKGGSAIWNGWMSFKIS